MAETQTPTATTAGVQTAVGTMGTQHAINITSQMMTDAMKAITDYKSAVETAYSSLETTMDGIPNNFTGAAANGFNKFYTESVKPMLEKNGSLAKMLDSLYDICDSAQKQLPGQDGVDESLAKINNQNAGGAGAVTAGADTGTATAGA